MNDIVTTARRWLGTPYLHQASERGIGADCLGLIRGVWREIDGREPEEVPAYSADWAEPQNIEVLADAARRLLMPVDQSRERRTGEVLLFRMRDGSIAKHLGIMAETAPVPTFVHAYQDHGVVESSLSAPWARRIVARFDFPAYLTKEGP